MFRARYCKEKWANDTPLPVDPSHWRVNPDLDIDIRVLNILVDNAHQHGRLGELPDLPIPAKVLTYHPKIDVEGVPYVYQNYVSDLLSGVITNSYTALPEEIDLIDQAAESY